jgi:hypothetical protein
MAGQPDVPVDPFEPLDRHGPRGVPEQPLVRGQRHRGGAAGDEELRRRRELRVRVADRCRAERAEQQIPQLGGAQHGGAPEPVHVRQQAEPLAVVQPKAGAQIRPVRQHRGQQLDVRCGQPEALPDDRVRFHRVRELPVQLDRVHPEVTEGPAHPLVPERERQREGIPASGEGRVRVRAVVRAQRPLEDLVHDVEVRQLTVGVLGVERDRSDVRPSLDQRGRRAAVVGAEELQQVGQVGRGRVDRPRLVADSERQIAEKRLVARHRPVKAHPVLLRAAASNGGARAVS